MVAEDNMSPCVAKNCDGNRHSHENCSFVWLERPITRGVPDPRNEVREFETAGKLMTKRLKPSIVHRRQDDLRRSRIYLYF